MKNKNFLIGVKRATIGLFLALRTERNFTVYLIHILITLPLNILLRFTITQHLIWGITVAGVFSAECINTALEKICNFLTEEYNEKIRDIKDIAAGAVCCWGIAFYAAELIMIGLKLFA